MLDARKDSGGGESTGGYNQGNYGASPAQAPKPKAAADLDDEIPF